jgi:hypothetical protein
MVNGFCNPKEGWLARARCVARMVVAQASSGADVTEFVRGCWRGKPERLALDAIQKDRKSLRQFSMKLGLSGSQSRANQ